MKIELFVSQDYDCNKKHRLVVDGKDVARITPLSECPEDAIIGRDLIDGNDIVRYIKIGYDAAKRGETIEFTESEDKE